MAARLTAHLTAFGRAGRLTKKTRIWAMRGKGTAFEESEIKRLIRMEGYEGKRGAIARLDNNFRAFEHANIKVSEL